MPGQNGQLRIGFERKEGVPGNDMTFVPITSETLDTEPDTQPDPNLNPSGNRGQSLLLGLAGSGNIVCAPNSESLLKVRAHMHGYNEVTTPVAGVKLWTLRDFDETEDTAVAYYKDSMHAGIWRDERDNPTEYHAMGMKASQMQLVVGAHEIATMTHTFLFLRDTYMKKPDEVAVNVAFTGDINVRGHRAEGDENGDEYNFKVGTVGTGLLGSTTFLFGKNGVYGTEEHVTAEVMDVHNVDDSLAAGDSGIPFQILITMGGAFTAGDEWKIEPRSPKPVQVVSDRPLLHGMAAEVMFTMGTTFTRTIEQFTLTQNVPREAEEGIGSLYSQSIGVPANAQRWWTFGFDAPYNDLKLKQALLQQRTISVYVKLRGKQIGATAYQDFGDFTIESMNITQAGATLVNAGRLPESPVLESFGGCVERWQNTIASITPP